MKRLKKIFLLIYLSFFLNSCEKISQSSKQAPNIFLITLDGVRWQEVFYGIDDLLVNNSKLSTEKQYLNDNFNGSSSESKRKKLMPFFWKEIFKNGKLYGDIHKNSFFSITNNKNFSYPGYNEILTGDADSLINSNNKIYNKNITVLEKLNNNIFYKDKVAAFCSWDVFPYIINDKRSGIPVNAGYMPAESMNLNSIEKFINKNQKRAPVIWESVRLDVFTHNLAFEYLKKNKPKVIYIAYGETDDFAHMGDYDQYIKSLHNSDQMIEELWEYVQNDKFYKDNTYFIITTDHGRGTNEKWSGHGNSKSTWAAILGPNLNEKGIIKNSKNYTNQIAPTIEKITGISENLLSVIKL
tara:strand:- start:53 stop:1114 length:1062 start_codon:yes stop_codon:yes gene_type:complete